MAASAGVLIFLAVVSTAAIATVLALGIVQSIPGNSLFNHSMDDLGKKYPSDINPAPYTFSIWGLIYLFQFGWLAYVYSTMCRSNSSGMILVNPVILPKKFYFAWILSCTGVSAWYFYFDAGQLLISALLLIGVVIFGFAALIINTVATARYERKLANQMYADLMCIRILIQNGLSLFFSWTLFAALISVSLALTYDPNSPRRFSQEDAGSLCLYILGGVISVWTLLENTKLFRLAKYIYAWYLVLMWSLAGIIVRYPDVTRKNTIITIILLCVSVVCLIVKIVVYVCTPSAAFGKNKKYKLLDEE